jgi:protein-S-isoprenylcysteine O-methyltransferase Ste14
MPEAATSSEPRGFRLDDFVVRHRVPISTVVIAGLLAENLIRGEKPRFGWLPQIDAMTLVGAILVAVGLAIRGWAAGILRKGQDLTTDGPYSLCRHPLYLGSFVLTLGFCAILGYWHDLIVVAVCAAVIYRATMLREERRLAERYAERWPGYAARTPRLLPWKPGAYVSAGWSVAQWRKSREYQAVLVTVLLLVAIEIWRLA